MHFSLSLLNYMYAVSTFLETGRFVLFPITEKVRWKARYGLIALSRTTANDTPLILFVNVLFKVQGPRARCPKSA